MTTRPKTIQIFLPAGDPQGIRVAEITTRIVQVIEVPRKILGDFLAMPESAKVALYFLFGSVENGQEAAVYIGQTGDLTTRLSDHQREKGFWERALVLISRTDSLTQTHTLFLEWHCLQVAKEVDRYKALNGNSGSKPYTPAPLEADCLEIFETGQTLLATLGYPIFEPLVRSVPASEDAEMLYCRASGANGRGFYTEEGLVVLKNSTGRRDNVKSIQGTADEAFRKSLVESGVMKEEGETVVFVKDFLFRSPSRAATALAGRTANGWIEWKDKDGKTLDALRRQTAPAAQ